MNKWKYHLELKLKFQPLHLTKVLLTMLKPILLLGHKDIRLQKEQMIKRTSEASVMLILPGEFKNTSTSEKCLNQLLNSMFNSLTQLLQTLHATKMLLPTAWTILFFTVQDHKTNQSYTLVLELLIVNQTGKIWLQPNNKLSPISIILLKTQLDKPTKKFGKELKLILKRELLNIKQEKPQWRLTSKHLLLKLLEILGAILFVSTPALTIVSLVMFQDALRDAIVDKESLKLKPLQSIWLLLLKRNMVMLKTFLRKTLIQSLNLLSLCD